MVKKYTQCLAFQYCTNQSEYGGQESALVKKAHPVVPGSIPFSAPFKQESWVLFRCGAQTGERHKLLQRCFCQLANRSSNFVGMVSWVGFINPERGKGKSHDREKGGSDEEIDGVVKGIKGRWSDRWGSCLYSSLLAVSPAGGRYEGGRVTKQ